MKYLARNAIASLLLLAGSAYATDWYFLEYNPPSGEKFIRFSGDMSVPELPSAATYYLWPGLQPTDNSGVYQNVMDGNSGTWWIGSGWCCSNPSLSWGGGFNVHEGETVSFYNVEISDTEWFSELRLEGSDDSAANSFPLSDKSFDQALFAIELDGPTWDFGPLTFSNVIITSTGLETSWCTDTPSNYDGSTKYTISGVTTAVVDDDRVQCRIEKLVMEGPSS